MPSGMLEACSGRRGTGKCIRLPQAHEENTQVTYNLEGLALLHKGLEKETKISMHIFTISVTRI